MANILDYLDWYGDVSLDAVPFNEVDNVILAQLAYCNLENVVPTVAEGTSITMEEAAERFQERNGKGLIYGWAGVVSPYTVMLPQKLAQGRRFSQARLGMLHSRLDTGSSEQLCVFHVTLSDGSTYVTFRGTDDTLVGWREDFEMTYDTVRSQTDAVTYLDITCADVPAPIMLGGHSKGGNLAVYAAARCAPAVRDKISVVWNDDGPGFDPDVLSAAELDRVRDRVRTIVPEFDVVGQLLSLQGPARIIRSDERGVMQHSALSWQVLGPRFVAAEPQELLPEARAVNRAFDAWLGSADHDKRRHVFTEFFDSLEHVGVNTLSDLMSGDPSVVAGVTAQIAGADPETRDYIMDLLGVLASGYMQSRVSEAAQATSDTVQQLLEVGGSYVREPSLDEESPLDIAEMERYQRYVARRRGWKNFVRWLGLDRTPVRVALLALAGAALGAGVATLASGAEERA